MAASEHLVGRLEDLMPGTMTEVEVMGRPVLVVRHDADVVALAARCPHYGAPLAEGVLAGDMIVCPWHHACFHARTGAVLEPPALDGLDRFRTRVEDGRILVTLPGVARQPPHAVDPASDPRCFVIAGAGAAAACAALALRERRFRGRIVMIGEDPEPPYDRTLLTKELMQGARLPSPLALRPEGFWREHGIELRLGVPIARLDARERSLALADGSQLRYDRALVATGGRPRRLEVPGAGLSGIFTLRSLADMRAIVGAAASAGRVLVAGSSFIALECAWSLREHGLEVSLVAPEEIPLAALFGPRVGARLLAVQRALGTGLHLGRQIARFEGDERLRGVVLDDGQRLAAEVAVLGIGVEPATGFLQGVALDEDGSVPVDAQLQAAPDLYAAGDVARFPLPATGERVRIEHWRLACQHGALAARNMLGASEAYGGVPFFWSAQQLALYYVGHASGFDEIVYDGAPEDGPFIAYFLRAGQLLAALGVERNAEMAALEALMRRRRLPAAVDLRRGGFRATAALAEAALPLAGTR